ncbi:LOW QUALITY PROTEIN: hypothetical protein PHMEG_00025894 [Phytophthora megakarya]|uniref:Uncharacterized protein n=1 Tax=Phytophthora megakarya TaxID=4795 RepID=A0A225VAX4_9STRA|nr:LOW QUALITY PROTEIN: hypothetical protein PHMEG_00025894 [Phytophthora megakarya]
MFFWMTPMKMVQKRARRLVLEQTPTRTRVLGVSGPDVPEQASVGGAVKVESPAVDGTSERSQLGHDVIEEKAIPGETPTIKLEGPLSTAKEEATSDILGGDSQSRLETLVSSSSCVQVPNEEAASRMQVPSSTQETVDLTAMDDAGASKNPVVPNLVKLYVDDQEQVSLEYVMSPMIEYACPHPAPNFQAWYGTAMATSEYLASRMSSGARAQTWISKWRLVRLAPNMATDLASVTVPLNELSTQECAAVLQTMFVEVVFKFRSLVPEWFRVSTPKAEVDTMRRVAEELQHFLTIELLEWQQVISGVQCRVVSPLDARNLNDHSEEMKPEDAEGDSLMSSYEVELLGSECVTRWRKAGVRVYRSPASSSLGEPESKRQQHAPPRPSTIPSMSSLMSYRTSTQDDRSMATPSDMSATRSGSPMPISGYGSTLFGATATNSDESNLSGTPVIWEWFILGVLNVVYDWRCRAAHAVCACPPTRNSGGVAQPESSLGVQVTEAVLPVSPMPANPDDVVMSRGGPSVGVTTGRGHLGSTPTDEGQARAMIPRVSQSPVTTLGNAGIRGAFIQMVAKSVDQVGNDKPVREIALFGDVALNAMRSTQDMLTRMESKQDTTQLNQRVDQAFQAIQMLAARPGVIKSVTFLKVEAPTAPAHVSTGVAEAVSNDAASHEVARALKAAETQLEERW